METLDYLNQNSLRNYPIQDGLGRVSNDGLFTIPNSLIVDLSVSAVSSDILPLYISTITCSPTSLTIEISAFNIGVFGSFNTTLPLSQNNLDVTLQNSQLFPSASGIITIGSIDDLSALPQGSFTFSPVNTSLLMKTYSPVNVGVSWISFSDNNGNTSALTGHINMTANSNLQFRDVDGLIYMDAGEDLGLNKSCSSTGTPVSSINGIPPDSTGNFTLIPEGCVAIDSAQYGLVISDSCGQPCLGCDAIATLTTQLNSLEASIIDIGNFTNNLQAAITQATTLINYQCQCS